MQEASKRIDELRTRLQHDVNNGLMVIQTHSLLWHHTDPQEQRYEAIRAAIERIRVATQEVAEELRTLGERLQKT